MLTVGNKLSLVAFVELRLGLSFAIKNIFFFKLKVWFWAFSAPVYQYLWNIIGLIFGFLKTWSACWCKSIFVLQNNSGSLINNFLSNNKQHTAGTLVHYPGISHSPRIILPSSVPAQAPALLDDWVSFIFEFTTTDPPRNSIKTLNLI